MSADQRVRPQRGWRAPDQPWSGAPFRWFFLGQTVSVLGSGLSPVALAFAVLNASGKASNLAIVLVAQDVPLLIFLVIGGAVADRVRRSTVLIYSNLGAGVTQAAVAVLLLSGHYRLPVIACLEVANGTFSAFTQPALRGIVPQLVSPAARQRANSANATAKNFAKIIGPSLAGLLVVTAGGGWAIGVDAASYLFAAVCMTRVALPAVPAAGRAGIGRDILAGWTEFRSLPWVVVIVSAFALTNCILGGVWLVLGPVIARATIGETAWGVVLSARAVGLLIMGVVLYRVTARHLLAVSQLCAALFALQLIVLGLDLPATWLISAAFIGGLGSAVTAIGWETSLQEHVPAAALSRVSSYDSLGSFAAVPIGQIAVVPVAAAVGDARLAVTGGIGYALISLGALAFPSVRNLNHARHSPA